MGKADREPDPHARDGAEDKGEKDEEPTVLAHVGEHLTIAFAPGLALRQDEEEPATDGEMGYEDVGDGDQGDHDAAAQQGHFPEGIIHTRSSPRRVFEDDRRR